MSLPNYRGPNNGVSITYGVEERHYQISHRQLIAIYPLGEEILLAEFRVLYLDDKPLQLTM